MVMDIHDRFLAPSFRKIICPRLHGYLAVHQKTRLRWLCTILWHDVAISFTNCHALLDVNA